MSWDVVPDESNSCARSSIVYVVTVVGEANGTIISMNDAQAEITDLEPGQNYSISVRARLAQGTCETREAATAVCRTSDDLSPTTATPGIQAIMIMVCLQQYICHDFNHVIRVRDPQPRRMPGPLPPSPTHANNIIDKRGLIGGGDCCNIIFILHCHIQGLNY